MYIKARFALLVLLLISCGAYAQTGAFTVKDTLKSDIVILTSQSMHGRGYVSDGRNVAAAFIAQRFTDLGLKPAPGADSYVQGYTFPVNTFPGKMMLAINGKELKAGDDYLTDAASASFTGKKLKVKRTDLKHIKNNGQLQKLLAGLDGRKAYYLLHTDEACKTLGIRMHELTARLPKGCYIIGQTAKLTWTVSQQANGATMFYVKQESLPRKLKTLDADILAVYEPKAQSVNIIAQVPGEIKDSFIVFSAHYDHLGMMGSEAMFPGGSDNASGTAMLLYLAGYYAAHPQRYTVLFLSFSGEEAGLMGSQYFVAHPLVPLSHIKFLTNVDIMGDASDGVTVVNATEYPAQYSRLTALNEAHKYLPVIKSRGKAANSDHYYFSEGGVPAFFLYTNGGKGHYHDIFDTAEEISLNNVDGVVHLLTAFANGIR